MAAVSRPSALLLWSLMVLTVGLAFPIAAEQHSNNTTAENVTNTTDNDTPPPDDAPPPEDRSVVPWAALIIGLLVFLGAVVFSRRE